MRLPLPVSINDAIDAARQFARWHGVDEDKVRMHTEDDEAVFTVEGHIRHWHCTGCQVGWYAEATVCWMCGIDVISGNRT